MTQCPGAAIWKHLSGRDGKMYYVLAVAWAVVVQVNGRRLMAGSVIPTPPRSRDYIVAHVRTRPGHLLLESNFFCHPHYCSNARHRLGDISTRNR
jgi:hypothetical protein